MPTENELEELTNGFLDGMISSDRRDFHGRKAEQVEIMGAMAECGRTDCVSGKDVLQD